MDTYHVFAAAGRFLEMFFSFWATVKRCSHINDTDIPRRYHSNTERRRMLWRTAQVSNCRSVMCVIHWDFPSLGTMTMLIVQAERTDHSKHHLNSHPGAETGCASIDSARSTLNRTTHSVKRSIPNVNPSSYCHALKGKQIFKLLGFPSIVCYHTKLHSLARSICHQP